MEKEKIKIDVDELKEDLRKDVANKLISELVLLKDEAKGWVIEIQSGSCSQEELFTLAWNYSQNFFNRTKVIPSYIQ